MLDHIDAVRADITDRLAKGASCRNSAMHTPVVGTADADVRVMVLRHFDPDEWTLRFHTDLRAPKCAVVAADPRIGVLLYDREAKIQMRVRGRAWIEHEGETADHAWQQSTNFARRCYLGDGPGTASDSPTSGLPEEVEGVEPGDAELVPARENFAVLIVEIEEVDWFFLSHDGHRRALVTREGGQWITP